VEAGSAVIYPDAQALSDAIADKVLMYTQGGTDFIDTYPAIQDWYYGVYGDETVAYFAVFSVPKNLTVGSITMQSESNTPVDPNVARMGLWHMTSADTGTLVAETEHDPTLFSVMRVVYTRNFSDTRALPLTYTLQAGERYAVGAVCYGHTEYRNYGNPPQAGTNYSTAGVEGAFGVGVIFDLAAGYVMNGAMANLTDLPATLVLDGSYPNYRPWARLA
jgi:hypothetical protein